MGKTPKNITERVQTAWINPELDKVKKGAKAALKEMKENPEGADIAAVLLKRAFSDLDVELSELERLGIVIPESERNKFKQVYERRFRVHTADMEKTAILESPEKLQIDAFVDDYAHYTGLDRLIEEANRKQSKDPLHKLVRMARASTPLLAGIGSSLAKWLEEGKKEEKGKKPSRLEAAAARVDEETKKATDKAGEKTKDQEEENVSSGSTSETVSAETSTSEDAETDSGSFEGTTEVESLGGVTYEINPDDAERLSPEDFRKRYQSIESRSQRNMFVLQQVAAGNASNAFEKLKITGGTGMTVEMEVDRSGMRVAGMDVQVDGPTAMAAAQISSCTLPTPWISEQIWKQAKGNDNAGVIKFVDYGQIAQSLGIPDEKAYSWVKKPGKDKPERVPNGDLMMSAEFALKRDELLKKYRREHNISDNQLTAGYFKDIVHPIPGITREGRLEIYGAKGPDGLTIQPPSGGVHEASYSDYSHGVRRVRNKVKVTENGKTTEMDISAFYADPKYATEFGFTAQKLGQAYAYTTEIQKVVDEAKKKKDDKPKDK